MSVSLIERDVRSSYQSSLCELTQAIEWGQGQFSLILAHCNSPAIRQRAIEDLECCQAFPLYTVALQPEAELMFSSISCDLTQQADTRPKHPIPYHRSHSIPGAIAISGFETVIHIDTLLASADTVREELRKVFHCPLIWWMNDATLVKLIRLAPNIHSWFTSVEFLSEPELREPRSPIDANPEPQRPTRPPVAAARPVGDRQEKTSPIVWSPTPPSTLTPAQSLAPIAPLQAIAAAY